MTQVRFTRRVEMVDGTIPAGTIGTVTYWDEGRGRDGVLRATVRIDYPEVQRFVPVDAIERTEGDATD